MSRCVIRCHIGPAPIIKRCIVYQQMPDPVALVLGVVAGYLARTHPLRWPDLLHALLARLIHTDHRMGRIVRPGIHFQHVLRKCSVYWWGGGSRSAESAAEVAPERVEPDVFPGQRVGTMHVEFAAALGLTDVGPVGGAVAGTGEAVGLHEGLQQERSVAVASLPVVRQAAAAASQHRGSEIAHLHPGQDQEAGVVHDQLQAGFALGNAPADDGRGEPPSRRWRQSRRPPARAAGW